MQVGMSFSPAGSIFVTLKMKNEKTKSVARMKHKTPSKRKEFCIIMDILVYKTFSRINPLFSCRQASSPQVSFPRVSRRRFFW